MSGERQDEKDTSRGVTAGASQAEEDSSGLGRAEATGRVELAEEDFYMEGPYVVFTAAYHLKRGSCCHSECRHCPFR